MPSARAAAAAASRFSTLNAPRRRERTAIPSTVHSMPSRVTRTSRARMSARGPMPNDVAGIAASRKQALPGRVVGVHDRPRRVLRREEPRLRLEVRLHRAVEVQVVLRQVREDRDVEHDAVHAVLLERVRRHLQRRPPDASVAHPRQQPVQVGRLRRRARQRDRFAGDARAGGPDDAGGPAGGLEDRRQQIGDGRLAVRAGHADRGHRRRRIRERPRGHRPHRLANRGHAAPAARRRRAIAPRRAPPRPASAASCANACPSTWRPGTQKNSAPGTTSLESNATSVTTVRPSPRIVAPGAAATRSASGTGGKAVVTASELTRAPVRG